MMLCLLVVLVMAYGITDSEIIQAKYQRYFVDKIINLGNTNLYNGVPFRSCGLLCEQTKDCAGFHFEKNYEGATESVKTACKLQIAKEGEFPKSFFSKVNSSYYGRNQNPLQSKGSIDCDPIDPSLSYVCFNTAPTQQAPSISCDVTLFGNQPINYTIQTTMKVKSAVAHFTCAKMNSKAKLARITDKRLQDWFCNMLNVICGPTTERAFTIGLYRKSATSAWRYGSAGMDQGPVPEDFYQNWYDDKDGVDDDSKLCVQMLSGAPYHFKWKITSCDNGTIAYPLCETDV